VLGGLPVGMRAGAAHGLILGDVWPGAETRQKMLSEAISIIRELWQGEEYSYKGTYFTVRDARIYTLPDKLPPIYLYGCIRN
ncbi:MAG TPA: LLM class flavin-dependent oxidoreductase, partial [Anaerolineales bacterium]|nr:LLM class flavin-dependent oxidoreductase [Anaerolineales bacterium]